MTFFPTFSAPSSFRTVVLTLSLFVGLISGCSTEIDPTHPYDPDNPKLTQVQITLNLLLPSEGPDFEQIVVQWVHVEDPSDFGLLSINPSMLTDDGEFQKIVIPFNRAIAGEHYVLFAQGQSGYSLNPQSSIFYVEEDLQNFTFEFGFE